MTALRKTLRTADDLVEAGLLDRSSRDDAARVAGRYAVAVTPLMAGLVDPSDAACPIARQFVPDVRELDINPAERADPIGDHNRSPLKGIVHRYHDRVLLKMVSVCPVYCRFCFRREMVGPDHGSNLTTDEIAAALAYVRGNIGIAEVILTGGDPFMLSPRRASEITSQLSAIPHVRVLRWHTRVPIVAPERVCDAMAEAITATNRAVSVAVHVNHPRELTAPALSALRRLADRGLTLLSQTVLLRGVNDDAATLEALMRRLVAAGVKPYYLHHGDLAPGSGHFRTTIVAGMALMDELRRRLTAFELPVYALDIPGGYGKVPVGAAHVRCGSEVGTYLVRDRAGGVHVYRDVVAR